MKFFLFCLLSLFTVYYKIKYIYNSNIPVNIVLSNNYPYSIEIMHNNDSEFKKYF